MTHIEQAIREADDAGYNPGTQVIGLYYQLAGTDIRKIKGAADGFQVRVAAILLDPAFWQALGKARGWKTVANGEHDNHDEWWHNARAFMTHFMDGKEAESFFASLTSSSV
jgi:hypothetical protein